MKNIMAVLTLVVAQMFSTGTTAQNRFENDTCQRDETNDEPGYSVEGEKYTVKSPADIGPPGAHLKVSQWVCIQYVDDQVLLWPGPGVRWTNPVGSLPMQLTPVTVTPGMEMYTFDVKIIDVDHSSATDHPPFRLQKFPPAGPNPGWILIIGAGHGPGQHGGHAGAGRG